jgi:hypothetical protein
MKYLNTDSMRFYSKIIYEKRFFRIRVYANKFNNYYPKIRIVYE